jgi:hypothetical protein
MNCESWEDLRQDMNVFNLTQWVYRRLANAENFPSQDAVRFLCSYNNVRRSGNTAAHTAKLEDVKEAVTTKDLESNERDWLEQLFLFTYGESV